MPNVLYLLPVLNLQKWILFLLILPHYYKVFYLHCLTSVYHGKFTCILWTETEYKLNVGLHLIVRKLYFNGEPPPPFHLCLFGSFSTQRFGKWSKITLPPNGINPPVNSAEQFSWNVEKVLCAGSWILQRKPEINSFSHLGLVARQIHAVPRIPVT